MKVLTGHLTQTNKLAIKAILDLGLTDGKVGKVSYFLTKENDIYHVKMLVKDRGLIPVAGSPLRWSNYYASFTL